MKEIREIITAFHKAEREGKSSALATVVHVDGSSYRRPGARMLITEDGELTGAISGGCLEKDALRKALLAMMEKKAKLVTYDTNDEDDAKMGMGLGCNGIIQVLIEPIDTTDQCNPIQLLKTVADKRQHNVLVTLFSLQDKKNPQYGTCLLVSEDGTISGKISFLKEILITDATSSLLNKASGFKNYLSGITEYTAFIETIPPPLSLIVVGAGNDAIPIEKMADILGWETTIIDGRAGFAKKERFISACQVLVSKPEKAIEQVLIDDQTVFLLMTHNYNYDLAVLRSLLTKKVRYIGSLGPKKKLDRMLDELKEEGIIAADEQLLNLYGPVGLDIGAETSEEIALAILAEIKTVFSSKEGQSLRAKPGAIHSRFDLLIEQGDIRYEP
jgi:xanthine dehydrogenase accessory factor